MKFIHLTDPHLTAKGDLFDVDVDGQLRAAVASINARHADAQLVMITGDIAHWGETGAYDRARAIFQTLKMPWYPLIGNHDDRDAFFAGLPAAMCDDQGRACFRLDVEAGTFLALDTLIEGTHAGRIDADQLAWLEKQLAELTGAAFIFMHHPPMLSGINGMDNIRLQNPDDLAAVLARHPGKVRHLFFGHMHRAFHGSWNGLPFSTVKATAHQIAAVFDSGLPLMSSRELPNYAVVLISPETVAIHDVSYLEEDTEFDYNRDYGRAET